MDKAMYDKGLGVRRKVLGDAYVDAALKNVDDFNQPLPPVIIVLSASLQSVDYALEQAAMIHGARRFRAFREVTLPLILPGDARRASRFPASVGRSRKRGSSW